MIASSNVAAIRASIIARATQRTGVFVMDNLPDPLAKVPCGCCKGKKIQKLTIESHIPGKPTSMSKMDIACVWCHGTGEMTPDELHKYQHMGEIWCHCGNKSGQTTYHDDTPTSKHHWTCDDCGKVTQIG